MHNYFTGIRNTIALTSRHFGEVLSEHIIIILFLIVATYVMYPGLLRILALENFSGS